MAYQKSVETKQKIRVVAERLFREKGFHNVNMNDISEAAGVVRSSLYYYYKNKEAIAEHIFDDILGKIFQVADDLQSNKKDALLQIVVFHILYFRHIALNEATNVIFDVIDYTEYNHENLLRLQRLPIFQRVVSLYLEYGLRFDNNERITYLYLWNACSKVLCKGVMKGTLKYTFDEALDYFISLTFLLPLNIPRPLYEEKKEEAYRLCNSIDFTP